MTTHKPIGKPYWNGRGHRRNRVCQVAGVPNNYASHQPGLARIDASIARIIYLLNASGVTTEYCCSGLPCDHAKLHADVPPWKAAYIMVRGSVPRELFGMLPSGCILDGASIRFSPCGTRELWRHWKMVETAVRLWTKTRL
jgi:hypothetical protein